MTNLHSTVILILSLIFLNPLEAQFVEIIKDIAPGITGSTPENFAELDGKIFFFANDNSPAGLELWRSNGMESGTEMLGDLNSSTDNIPGGGFSQPFSNLAKLGNELYFLSIENNTPGATGDYTRSLFKIGSTGNPTLVKATDIEFFGSTELVVFDGDLYWIQSQNEVWKSDGTTAGTVKFYETTDRLLESIENLKVAGNELFFTQKNRDINSVLNNKIDIWRTDGTTAGTQFYKRAVGNSPTDCGGYGVQMFELDGQLAYTLDGNSMCSYESWLFVEGFDPISVNHAPVSSLGIFGATLKDGKLFYLTHQFGAGFLEFNLTVDDGVQTNVLKTFKSSIGGDILPLLNGNLLITGAENLWVTDGTAAGTKEIRDFSRGLSPKNVTKFSNGYLFFASEQTYTSDIYFTNGTVNGTRKIGDFSASNQVQPFRITQEAYLAGDVLYFNGNNGFEGEEPYIFELSQVSPSPVCNNNLFTNPSFEDGLTGWTSFGDAVIDSDANSGNSAVRLPAGTARMYQFVAAEPDKEYVLRGKAKTNEFVNTYMKFLTADWQPTGRGMSQRIYGNYSPFEQTFTAPSDAAWIEVSFTPSGDDDLLLDDLCLSVENSTSTAADLKITNVECPQQFPQKDEPITVQFTVQNQGNSVSDPSKTHLYRFLSTRFGSSTILADVDVPSLQPGESVQLTVTGNFPGGLPETYYTSNPVALSLGGLFLSFEVSQFPTNEADVDFYCKKTNTDLEIEIIPVTTEYDVSGDIVFKLKATNNGSEDAYNVATYFLRNIQLFLNFHQLSAVVETSDTDLKATGSGIQWEIPRLNAGTSEEISVTYHMGHQTQFPNGLPDDFLIETEISSGHNIDTNSANNRNEFLFKKNITQTGDEDNLTLTVVGDLSVPAWQNGTAYFEVTNRGGRAVNNIKIDFVLDQNVRLVGGNEYSASAGTTLNNFWTQNPTATIPSIGPGGLAHVQLNLFSLTSDEIKVYGQISEASGNDPTSTPGNGTPPVPNEDDEAVLVINGGTPPSGTPDLQMGSFIMGASLEQGEDFLSNFNFRNIGDGNITRPFSLKVYLSNDRIPSNDDFVVGNYDFAALPFDAGESHANRIVVAIPNNAPAGNYFLIYSLDADNLIAESNENNNLNSRNFEVTSGTSAQADLTISNLFLDKTTIKTGEVLNYKFDLANVGSENIPGSFNVRAYLSTDGDISPDDMQDGIVPTGNFDAGFSVNAVPGASTINLPEGDYYLILKVDADEQVAERDETNNTIQSFIQFKVDNGNPNPVTCDVSVGNGNLNCFELTPGTNNYQAVYDSSGYQITKTFDVDLNPISSSAAVQLPKADKFEIDSTSFRKVDADGNLIFQKTLPQTLADKLEPYPEAIEFNGGYVFFVWKNLPSNPTYYRDFLLAIRTDAIFNILNEEQVASGTGNPSGNRVGNIKVVGSNGIAFMLSAGSTPFVSLRIVLIDGSLQPQDEVNIVSGVFGTGGTITENACDRFTVSDFIGFSYCKSGGCYGGNVRDVDFSNGEIDILNSQKFEHRTQLGIGFERWDWFTETSDGGSISATREQKLPITPSNFSGMSFPLDETIIFTKNDANGNRVDQFSVIVLGAADVQRIYEENGQILIVKKTDGELSVSELDCYDDNPPPPGGADLDLLFPAFFASPAQWSFFGVPLTITNNGTEAATGIKVEFKKDDGVVYKGNDEFTSSQGSFKYYNDEIWDVGTLAPGESAVLTVNYFRLTANDLNIYAQVSAMDQADADSSPGNGSCCVSNEDDEAILALGAPSGNAVGSRSSIAENLDSREVFAILNAAPNPITDRLTLNVFSNENQQSDLIIYDLLGKPVLRQAVELTEGHNSISVDASALPSGILTVTMSPVHKYLRQVRVMKIAD